MAAVGPQYRSDDSTLAAHAHTYTFEWESLNTPTIEIRHFEINCNEAEFETGASEHDRQFDDARRVHIHLSLSLALSLSLSLFSLFAICTNRCVISLERKRLMSDAFHIEASRTFAYTLQTSRKTKFPSLRT